MTGRTAPAQRDRGAAVTEFLFVLPLLLLLFLGIVQVSLVLFTRNVLVADAAEGARQAANAAGSLAAGDARCAQFIQASLSTALAGDVTCHSTLVTAAGGLREVRTVVSAVLALSVLPVGQLHLSVAAHVLAEP